MLRVALPNKGTLAEPAATMMREAGYRQRSDSRDLSMFDDENEIERPLGEARVEARRVPFGWEDS